MGVLARTPLVLTMTELHKVQENCKKLVERGELTKEQAMIIILQKAQDMLLALKVPESQTWEIDEYGYMAQTIN